MTQNLVSWDRLNFLFFYKKILHALNALKTLKAQKIQKHHQAKAQNANKQISNFFPLRCFYTHFFIFVRCKLFCTFLYL